MTSYATHSTRRRGGSTGDKSIEEAYSAEAIKRSKLKVIEHVSNTYGDTMKSERKAMNRQML